MSTRARTKQIKPSIDPKLAQRIAERAATQALAKYDARHVEEVVKAALEKGLPTAVATALETLGIDPNHPEELRKDMIHLRTWRELMDMLRKEGVGTVFKWFLTSAIALVMLGISALIYKHS